MIGWLCQNTMLCIQDGHQSYATEYSHLQGSNLWQSCTRTRTTALLPSPASFSPTTMTNLQKHASALIPRNIPFFTPSVNESVVRLTDSTSSVRTSTIRLSEPISTQMPGSRNVRSTIVQYRKEHGQAFRRPVIPLPQPIGPPADFSPQPAEDRGVLSCPVLPG